MNLETLEKLFLSFNGASKEFPFGEDVMVFKVKNKMFGLISLKDNPLNVNLKCDPHEATIYRELYECVNAGYHMNKKHWNTITMDGTMKEDIFSGMVEDSYNLIVSKLSKREKLELGAL